MEYALAMDFATALENFVIAMEMLVCEDEEEDEDDYFYDDVDETFYDPYMGCDFYE